jgi:hypothetical protein
VLPFIVRQNSWVEWSNALWLLDLQTAHVSAHGTPTFFIDAPDQYFYPHNIFYAGPLLSILAYPAVVLGTWPVFATVTAGAYVASSAGLSWTARNLGVPLRLAILPGVLFALSPYAVSNLYGRGAWTELMAVSAFAVALGAATSITSGRARSEASVLAVLALAVAMIAGTHNITLLFAALASPLLGLALLPLLRGSRTDLLRRHLLVLAGAIIGVAICGAFLIPDVWLASRTLAASSSASFLEQFHNFDSFGAIFNPTAGTPPGTVDTDIRTQTLVVPFIWLVLVAGVTVYRRKFDRRTILSLALLGVLGLGVALLITHPSWWLGLPTALRAVEFPYRLVTYLTLLILLGVVVLLASPSVQRNRPIILALVLVTGWQLGVALDLALTSRARGSTPAPTHDTISASSTPPAFTPNLLQASEYRLSDAHPLSPPEGIAAVVPVGDDSPPQIELSGGEPPGSLVATNVVASPLIHATGAASIVGASPEGFAVLRVKPDAATPWHAKVSSVCGTCLSALTGKAPFALLAGRLASLLGVLALLGLAVAGFRPEGWGARLRRRSASP